MGSEEEGELFHVRTCPCPRAHTSVLRCWDSPQLLLLPVATDYLLPLPLIICQRRRPAALERV